MAEQTEKQVQQKRQERATGVVSSAGGSQTCRVVVDHLVQHPLYGKTMSRKSKMAVHDPKNEAKVGDTVEISPCRPISKTKRWRLIRIVKKATLLHSAAQQ